VLLLLLLLPPPPRSHTFERHRLTAFVPSNRKSQITSRLADRGPTSIHGCPPEYAYGIAIWPYPPLCPCCYIVPLHCRGGDPSWRRQRRLRCLRGDGDPPEDKLATRRHLAVSRRLVCRKEVSLGPEDPQRDTVAPAVGPLRVQRSSSRRTLRTGRGWG
jgi:hypothetical protein